MAAAMDLLPWTFTDVDSNHPAMMEAREHRNETAERRMESLEELMEMLCGKFDPNISSFEELLRLDALILEMLLQNPVTQLCGITAILDLKHFSVTKASDISPKRKSCTLRIVKGYILNAPDIANTLFNLMLPLMSENLRDTLIFHPVEDLEGLHASIPTEILPEEYGGQLSDSELVNLYDLLNYNEDYFLSQMQCGFPQDYDLQKT